VARTTQSGVSCSTFDVAVQRRFKGQDGKREADFLTVVAWRQTADYCNKYMTKGSRVAVEGSIQKRSYTAQDNTKRYVTEIIADSVEGLGSPNNDHGPTPPPSRDDASPDEFTEVDDDELPFK
jgi:single-strand DNA-binding protein